MNTDVIRAWTMYFCDWERKRRHTIRGNCDNEVYGVVCFDSFLSFYYSPSCFPLHLVFFSFLIARRGSVQYTKPIQCTNIYVLFQMMSSLY